MCFGPPYKTARSSRAMAWNSCLRYVRAHAKRCSTEFVCYAGGLPEPTVLCRRQNMPSLEEILFQSLEAERKLSEERALLPGLLQHDLANVLCHVSLSASMAQ